MGELKARARWTSENLYKRILTAARSTDENSSFALTHLAQNRQAKRVRRDHFRFADDSSRIVNGGELLQTKPAWSILITASQSREPLLKFFFGAPVTIVHHADAFGHILDVFERICF